LRPPQSGQTADPQPFPAVPISSTVSGIVQEAQQRTGLYETRDHSRNLLRFDCTGDENDRQTAQQLGNRESLEQQSLHC
jgi:hypothetical protein